MKFLYAIAVASMAVACNSAIIDSPQRYGTISVSLGSPDVGVVTKADPVTLTPGSEGASDYTVRIFNDADEKMHEVTYDKFTEPKVLPFNKYYVTVENCTESAAEEGFGMMRLYGRTEDDIILDASCLSASPVINCTVANAKVSVVFDESVKGKFSSLTVTLTRAEDQKNYLQSRTVEVSQPASFPENAAEVMVETWFNASSVLNYTIEGKFEAGGVNNEISLSNEADKPIVLGARNHVKLVVRASYGEIVSNVEYIAFDTEIADPTVIPGGFNPYE